MTSRLSFLCVCISLGVLCQVSEGSDSEADTLSVVFRSQSGRELVQLIESEAGVTWIAIGNSGRVCDSGTAVIRIKDIVEDLRNFRKNIRDPSKLESVDLIVVGKNVEKSSLDRESLIHLFSMPQMRQIAESMNKSTRKVDRIRFIPDIVLRLPVSTSRNAQSVQNQQPSNPSK